MAAEAVPHGTHESAGFWKQDAVVVILRTAIHADADAGERISH